ncbi:DUF3306 domain-containing protein [Yoonia sp.]|uniref:DUF3306 domain-containing protein n=1 Tax=Yoonia sp. TaxID=2212373 RepID=UPI0025DE2BDD|nr:DUF3306 domain-containing protein [Yoonia sp.]
MTKPASDFWSRRKAKVADEAEAEVALQPDVAPEVSTEDLSDEEILAVLELPDPDTLVLGDDIKGFMSKAVPEHLRRRALRKLWRLNPVLACLDGLNDYDGDFTDAATVFPDMKTAYQVGKGMLAHVQEMARQAEVLLASNTDDVVEQIGEQNSDENQEVDTVIAEAPKAPQAVASQGHAAPRRRMRMSFEQDAPSEMTS